MIYISLTHFELHGLQKGKGHVFLSFVSLMLCTEARIEKGQIIIMPFYVVLGYARPFVPIILLETHSHPVIQFFYLIYHFGVRELRPREAELPFPITQLSRCRAMLEQFLTSEPVFLTASLFPLWTRAKRPRPCMEDASCNPRPVA